MCRAFTIVEWFEFVDNTDAFGAKVSGRVSNEKVVIGCSNGIDIFNRELFEIALDVMAQDDDWVEVYNDMIRHRTSSSKV